MAGYPAHRQASARVRREHAPLLESLMRSQGALAVSLTDVTDTPLWEPGVGETPLWEEVTVTGLFPAATDTALVGAALSLAPLTQLEWSELAGRPWERAWMDRFAPMRFGQRLWIVPTGMECPDPHATQLHLDPGLAFGTGTHPTTRLCLQWLDGAELEGREVLDFGCGSGVLGIAAALCGASKVLCVDHDPQAVTATRDNAERNRAGKRVEARQGDQPPPGRHHLVLANILASILLKLAPALAGAVRPGGELLLAGVLAGQAEDVCAGYAAAGLAVRGIAEEDGWVLLYGRRD